MILAVDIGGTKVNIALFKENKQTLLMKFNKQYQSQKYLSFTDILEIFLQQSNEKQIDRATIAIAGPIIDGKCTTTNLPWSITTKEIQESLQIDKVALINDLEGTAYGMLYLQEEDFISLNPKGIKKDGNKAIIAAGTGLGEAGLFYNNGIYHPLGCEGGHTDFASQSPLQDKLLIWLRGRFPEHVSYERVLCGSGIYLLYQFLCEEKKCEYHPIIQNNDNEDKSVLVSKLALEYNDELAQKTLHLFCNIYGAEAGNLALKLLSHGGVWIGGGIAPKILPILKISFMEQFLAKGRFKDLLENMEVKVSLEEKTALIGAAYFARDKL